MVAVVDVAVFVGEVEVEVVVFVGEVEVEAVVFVGEVEVEAVVFVEVSEVVVEALEVYNLFLNNDHLLRFLFLYFGKEAKANQNASYSCLNFASFTLLTKATRYYFLIFKVF